ncbi:MAG: MBL fold metallo-hydrolase, partial [Desulfobulbaceae bacterium]|nr:MBL fold metallo-hydrolase [Desulfobulbaceae bacterium]
MNNPASSGRITILCDNSVGPLSGTLGEHGFAALVEPAAGDPLLFDTGQGLTLLHNAARMGRDLSAVRQVVISHGHYDHTGGLLPLLRE